jgi:hypothetical protein
MHVVFCAARAVRFCSGRVVLWAAPGCCSLETAFCCRNRHCTCRQACTCRSIHPMCDIDAGVAPCVPRVRAGQLSCVSLSRPHMPASPDSTPETGVMAVADLRCTTNLMLQENHPYKAADKRLYGQVRQIWQLGSPPCTQRQQTQKHTHLDDVVAAGGVGVLRAGA